MISHSPQRRKDAEEKAFVALVGPRYGLFADSFQMASEDDDLDGKGARVFSGGVRGLYTITEAIIMVAPGNLFWAAAIDGDVVRYFTNVAEDKKKLPKTIENWRSRFAGKRVVFP